MPNLLTALRAATHESHERVERVVDTGQLCATRDGYVRLLRGLHEAHALVQGAWANAPAFTADEPTDRAQLIAADLRILGAAEPLPATRERPALPPLATRSHQLGVSYVVEGSTLGGQVLATIVGEQLGIGPDDGAAFLTLGARRPGHWREFKRSLAVDVAEDEARDACTSAHATFDLFARSLARHT